MTIVRHAIDVDFFAKQRIFLGGNQASRYPGRRSGEVMRNPNYTYADTMKHTLEDEGHRKNPFIENKQRE